MKAKICAFGKIFLLMILVFGVKYAAAQDISIKIDGCSPNEEGRIYLSQKQLDDIHSISTDSDEWEVVSFKVSTIVKGFCQDAQSTSDKITMQQHEIFKQAHIGGKIYFEDIKVQNKTTGVIKDVMEMAIFKDGICAMIEEHEHDGLSDAHIRVYPSFNSRADDTSRYSVKSFKLLTAATPKYAFCATYQGNYVDTTICTMLMSEDSQYDYVAINCIDNQTQQEFTLGKLYGVKEKYSFGFKDLLRSKEYFTKKNAKLDFIYKQNFKIDSVSVEFYNDLSKKTEEYTFKGDVFDDKFKKYIRNSVPVYSWINFYIYHSGGQCEGPISVYIVE